MNTLEEQKRDNYIKKLVSNSRAIVTNQIGLSLGIQKMYKISRWIDQIESIETIDLDIIRECYDQISEFPLGSERLNYQVGFLLQQEKSLEKIMHPYKEPIIMKCFEIIEKFGGNHK